MLAVIIKQHSLILKQIRITAKLNDKESRLEGRQ